MEYPSQDLLSTAEVEERQRMQAPAIILSGEVGRTEEFKRPEHPDFQDSSELKKLKWSGIRHNQIVGHLEIWKCGVIVASMNAQLAQMYPEKWEEMYEDAFDLKSVHQVSR